MWLLTFSSFPYPRADSGKVSEKTDTIAAQAKYGIQPKAPVPLGHKQGAGTSWKEAMQEERHASELVGVSIPLCTS